MNVADRLMLYTSRFVHLILDESTAGTRGHAVWAKVHRSLQHHPEQLSLLTSDARCQSSFLTNFETCVARIITFLQNTDSFLPRTHDGYLQRRILGTIIADRLLLPLLEQDQYQKLRDGKSFFDFLVHTLHLANQQSGIHLHRIAACLPNSPRLFGKLLSSDRSVSFLAQWIGSLGRGNSHTPTLAAWTEAMATLCVTCGLDHDNQEVLDKWASVKTLRQQLHQARTFLIHNSAGNLEPPFPDQIREILGNFGLPIPTSERLVETSLEHVEITLTSEVLSSLAKSMPCRICFTKSSDKADNSHVSFKTRLRQASVTSVDDFDHPENVGPFEKLLGRRLGIWKIVLSGQALKDLQQSKSEGNFEHIKNKLIDLSTGDWIRRSVATKVSLDHMILQVPLFEAEYAADGRILWQVDTGYDEGVSSASQIVRVWRIGHVKEVEKAYELIFRTQSAWRSQRIIACRYNVIDKKNAIKIPAILNEDEQTEVSEEIVHVGPNVFEARTAMDNLISGKFHVLTNVVFDNILHDNDYAEYPFDVSSKEINIITHFKTAAFVLGRSGTGKTTCLLYKLLSRYLASAQYVGTEHRLRQVLLTRSEPLARKLKLDLYRLIKTQLIARGELKELAKTPSEDTLKESPEGILGEKSLFSLQPEDFPLVCTFNEFISLVENTIRAHDRQRFHVVRKTGNAVNFTIFKAVYWPKIGVRDFDPGVVYSEIMGVIKGTVAFKNMNFCSLSRLEYMTRSRELASAFPTDGERDQVYDIFQKYEVLRTERREYDDIDNTLKFLDAIRQPSIQRKLYDIIQEIYVDEVQDQRGLEIELLLNLVQKPRGIHFAGDSAQCISNDSAFRFANLKALFYNHYSNLDPELAKPELLSLSRNFRSHQGILSFASFIMRLLWRGFPMMIDKLSPEIGQFLGPKPIIFVGADIDELLVRVGGVNFAKNQQTIIVRDEKTGIALQQKLKDNSIVYTILQSKGMEFDDVYLYNFFSSSPYPTGWRTLDTLLKEGDSDSGSDLSYANKHLLMCSELKNFYVAITRARSRLWILESQSNAFIQFLASMRGQHKQLVDVRNFDPTDVESEDFINKLCPMQTCTTVEEWNQTGEQCMDQKLYNQALRCFTISGDEPKKKWARGCIAEEAGRAHRAKGDMNRFQQQFKKAAENFLAINRISKAAECFEALNEFATAAELWSKQKRYEQAGWLFEKAGRAYIPQAAKEYYKAKLPAVVLNLYLRSGMYKEAVEDLSLSQNEISWNERKTFAQQLNTLLRQGKIPRRLKEKTFDLLLTDQEKVEFLRDFKYFDELWNYLAERDRLDEALNELIGACQLDLLLEKAFEADSGWQKSQQERLGEICHCVNAKRLLTAIADTTKPTNVDTACEKISNANYSRAIWAQEWGNMWRVARDQIKIRALPAKSLVGMESQQSINFLTTILIQYPEFFLGAIVTTSQLIITLQSLLSLGQLITKYELPSAVSVCLGLLSIGTGAYQRLPWSTMKVDHWTPPLAVQQNVKQQRLTEVEVNRYLRNKLCSALQKTIERAKVDILRTTHVCSRCTPRDNWVFGKPKFFKNQAINSGCCPSANLRKRIWYMVEICRLLGEITKVGSAERMFFSTPQINANFIFKLTSLLFYESSYRHNAATILHIAKQLTNEQQYELIRENIKIQMHNPTLNEPTWTQSDFFWLFRKHRVLTMLNIPLGQSVSIFDQSEKQKLNLELHLEIFRCYYQLQTLDKFSKMIEVTRKLIKNMRTFVYSKRLISYDAELVSLFEDIGTLLLFTGWQTELLVPQSWKERYLPHWIKYLGKATNKEQIQCQQALENLVILFSEMVDWLENHGGRIDAKARVFLTRRSLDFLIVMLINTRMTDAGNTKENSGIDHGGLFSAVQTVLEKDSLPTRPLRGVQHDQLIQPLLNAFEYYNGKDHLCLYLCRGRQRTPISASRGWLDTLGVEITSRPTCAQDHHGCGTLLMKSSPDISSLVMFMLRWDAANVIQRAFRNYQPRKAKAQAAAKVIWKYYKNIYLPRRAKKLVELQAQKTIRCVYLRYKWNKNHTHEQNSVLNLQLAFAAQRKQRPKLNKKVYYTRFIIMLTKGLKLCINLAVLDEKCKDLLTQATTLTQENKITKPHKKISKWRDELCRHSDKFRVFDLTESELNNRISAGMEFVKDVGATVDGVARDMKNRAIANVVSNQASTELKKSTTKQKGDNDKKLAGVGGDLKSKEPPALKEIPPVPAESLDTNTWRKSKGKKSKQGKGKKGKRR